MKPDLCITASREGDDVVQVLCCATTDDASGLFSLRYPVGSHGFLVEQRRVGTDYVVYLDTSRASALGEFSSHCFVHC